jgi:hypothetical protein
MAHFLLDADNWPTWRPRPGTNPPLPRPPRPRRNAAGRVSGEAGEGRLVPAGGFAALAGEPSGDIETLDVMERPQDS